MARSKYEVYFQEMLEQNRELFEEFIEIHNKYAENPKEWQEKFNEVGSPVLDVIRKYENRLCAKSGNTGYGKFTTTLADKFQAIVKQYFPKISQVGIIIQ